MILTKCRSLPTLAVAAVATLGLSGPVWAQTIPTITVPWLGDPAQPHQVFSGGQLTLQGSCRPLPGCTLTAATWDPGDGSGPQAVSFANPRAIELPYTYTGLDGQPFIATLHVEDSCGNTGNDTFRVVVRAPATLDVEVNMAIDEGLWYLHKTMTLSSSGGVDTGYWNAQNRPATTASAAQAFQINNHYQTGDPNEDPYVDTVARALADVFTQLVSTPIGVQTHGDPDANGNGIGLQVTNGSRPIYVGGQVMDGIVTSRTPDALATTGGADVLGRSYRDIVQDMMDMYGWGQVDTGFYQGSWRYSWESQADNSAAQWAAIGGLGAQAIFGTIVPQFVKDQNIGAGLFLEASQVFDGSGAGADGRFGYASSAPNAIAGMNTTPSGLVQYNWDGRLKTHPRWLAGEKFMLRNWTQLINNLQIYGMFATAKAMRLALPDAQDLLDGTFNWYRAQAALGDPFNGLARTLVNGQQASGEWDAAAWVTDQLATAWAIIILSPTVVEVPPVAVCEVDPVVTGVNGPIEFDGSDSFHLDMDANIVSYEWDFDGDHVYDASGVMVTHSYPAIGTYQVVLRVTDDQVPPVSATTSCCVEIIPPPIPPNADPGGPYRFCIGSGSLVLDGSNSSDLDGTIVSWEWDFDPQPLDLSFDDASGEMVDVTAFFSGLGPGLYDVALRVTDNDTGTNTDFTSVRVFDANNCPFVPPVFDPPTPCGETLMISSGVALDFSVCASDTDMGDIVTLSVSGLPAGASMTPTLPLDGNPVCSDFHWVPAINQIGNHVITFTATDNHRMTSQCQVTIEVAECFLLLGTGPGSDPINLGGHTYQSQLSHVYATYPVTMVQIPDIPLRVPDNPGGTPAGPGGQVNYVQRPIREQFTAQIVMFNPFHFPANPDQWSQPVTVFAYSDGELRLRPVGNGNGIEATAVSHENGQGGYYCNLPFSIDGL